MSYEIVLFDADDTLFDYSQSESFALTNALKEFGIQINNRYIERYRVINQQLWNEYEQGKITLKQLRNERFTMLFSAFDLDIDVNIFSERYLEYLSDGAFLIEGAAYICSYLQKNGYRTAVITNGIKNVQLKRIRKSEIASSFEHIIISEDAGYQKPHHGIFDYAFNVLNFFVRKKYLL